MKPSYSLWRGLIALIVSLSLSGCLEVHSKLKIAPTGEVEMSSIIDYTRMQEFSSQFGDTKGLSCEEFLRKQAVKNLWQCEQAGNATIKLQRHFGAEEAAAFVEIDHGLMSDHYTIKPAVAFGNLSNTQNEQKSEEERHAESLKNMAILKNFGGIMTMEIQAPGEFVAVGNNRPLNASDTLTIDLLDTSIWANEFTVQAENSRWGFTLGMWLLAALVVAGGVILSRKKTLADGMRKVVLPVAILLALPLASLPWWYSMLSQGAGKTETALAPTPAPTAAPAPVHAPDPAPEAPPPLTSAVDGDWQKYVDQHPVDVMENGVLAPRFQQVLGEDYDSVKNAVATASPTELEAGYIIGSGNAPHSGGMDTAIFGIDTQTGQIYAVWKQDNQIKAYGVPHEQRLPARLYRWYKEMGGAN